MLEEYSSLSISYKETKTKYILYIIYYLYYYSHVKKLILPINKLYIFIFFIKIFIGKITVLDLVDQLENYNNISLFCINKKVKILYI